MTIAMPTVIVVAGTIADYDPVARQGHLTDEGGETFLFDRSEYWWRDDPYPGSRVTFTPRPGNTASAIRVRRAAHPRFHLGRFLFSFQGRVSRRHYWEWFLLPQAMAAGIAWTAWDKPWVREILANPWMQGGLALIALWSHLAVMAKRWHDRGRSAWFVLLPLFPLAGAIWTVVECGFIRGERGDNDYGPDPIPFRPPAHPT